MKKIPVYPKYETNDYNSNDTNLHADFSQFLNEAKQYERKKNSEIISHSQSQVDSPKTKQEREKSHVKKKKKTWKSFVLTWWKGEKKSDNNDDDDDNKGSSRASNTRRGFTSGPIFSGGEGFDRRPHRPLSGPIMSSLFSPVKKADSEVPYMCVDQLGRPCVDKNYGPVYLVT